MMYLGLLKTRLKNSHPLINLENTCNPVFSSPIQTFKYAAVHTQFAVIRIDTNV